MRRTGPTRSGQEGDRCKILVGGRRLIGGKGERESCLIEDDMSRDENAVSGAIETAIPLVFRGLAEENARGRARGELMRRSGCDVGIAEAPKHSKRRVVRVCTMEEEEGGLIITGATGTAIEEKRGRAEGLGPVHIRHGGVGEERADRVVQGAEDTLGSPVLRRYVGA